MITVTRFAVMIGVLAITGASAIADPPDPAALVRQAREQEAWIDRVESLQLKAEIRWEKTPRWIEQKRRKLETQFPGADLSIFRELEPRTTTILEVAYDKARARIQVQDVGDSEDLRVWDGKRYTIYNHHDRRPASNGYLILRELGTGPQWLAYLGSFRAGPHFFWWDGPNERAPVIALTPKPEDFVYEGETEFRGTLCHVVSHWDSWTSLYISKKNGRLRGVRSGAQTTTKLKRSLIGLLVRNGHQVHGERDLERATASIPRKELAAIFREGAARLTRSIDPCVEHWVDDEKEVAPGCWLPMRQGVKFIEAGEDGSAFDSQSNELKILDAKVNPRLPDALFAIAFEEGEQINDQTTQPPLSYRYKHDISPQEWASIIAEGKKRPDRDRKRAKQQAELVARPAVEFPAAATWLNGKPLKMTDLAGKIVILNFWAEWSRPCLNDLPVLAALHARRPKGVVLVGVHPSGGEMAAIRNIIKDHDLEYPICIDAPAPKGATSWGALHDAYAANRLRNAIVIDGTGKIAATGELGEMLSEALKLAGGAR